MAKDEKMVDSPGFDPDRRVPFPPPEGSQSPFGEPRRRRPEEAPAKKPYHQHYDPAPTELDPTKVGPGPIKKHEE